MKRAIRFSALLFPCLGALLSCSLFERVPIIFLDPTVTVSYTGGKAGSTIRFLAQVDSHPYSPTQENSYLGDEGGISYQFTAMGASAYNLTQDKPLPASFDGADEWSGGRGSYASTGISVTIDASSDVNVGDVILLMFRVDIDLKYSIIAGGVFETNTVHQFIAP
jgi:hypothetical protein